MLQHFAAMRPAWRCNHRFGWWCPAYACEPAGAGRPYQALMGGLLAPRRIWTGSPWTAGTLNDTWQSARWRESVAAARGSWPCRSCWSTVIEVVTARRWSKWHMALRQLRSTALLIDFSRRGGCAV